MEKIVKLKDLKKTMRNIKDRWKEQCLDIPQVFFEEVLMNITIEEIKTPKYKISKSYKKKGKK